MVHPLQKQDNAKRKRKKGEPLPEDGALRPVPSSFSSVAEYVAVYEPLLLEECRAQILRGQDEAGGAAAHRARIVHCEAVNQFTFVKLQVDEQVRHHRSAGRPSTVPPSQTKWAVWLLFEPYDWPVLAGNRLLVIYYRKVCWVVWCVNPAAALAAGCCEHGGEQPGAAVPGEPAHVGHHPRHPHAGGSRGHRGQAGAAPPPAPASARSQVRAGASAQDSRRRGGQNASIAATWEETRGQLD